MGSPDYVISLMHSAVPVLLVCCIIAFLRYCLL